MKSTRALRNALLLVLPVLAGCATQARAPIDDRGVGHQVTNGAAHERTSVVGAPAGKASAVHVEALPAPAPLVLTPVPAAPPVAVPANPAVQSLLASAAQAGSRGDWERAQAALERAVKLAPDDAEVWKRLAYAHYRRGNLDQASEFAERAVALAEASGRPDPDLWRLVADIEAARGHRAAADNALRNAGQPPP